MADALSRWRGKQVHVIYSTAGEPPIQGKLIEVDTAGILIDLPNGPTFIPYTVIHQVIVLQDT
ncbi:MAG TPA: hypothetical protein VJL28_13880 [Gemmatimonadaceae bacterium]|nr:hypothetical protein [Gemmatimonadaceae bacterium]